MVVVNVKCMVVVVWFVACDSSSFVFFSTTKLEMMEISSLFKIDDGFW